MNYNYKVLISEKQFLDVARRARNLKYSYFKKAYILDDTITFDTLSGTDFKTIWHQKIVSPDYKAVRFHLDNYRKCLEEIRNAGLKIYCDCLAKGTRVLTRGGYKVIEEVQAGDEVLGSDSEWHVVVKCLKSDTKKKWYSVKVAGLREPLLVSEDHKILFSTYRPTNDRFSRFDLHTLKEYKLGELLCSPIKKGIVEFDKDYARMLGYYLAEGHIPKKGSVVILTLNQNEYNTIAEDIASYFTSIGVEVKRKLNSYQNQKWLTVIVYSKKFREDCAHFCGRGSKTKMPHTDILDWNDEAKEAFVIGHLLGDGAVDDSFRWLSNSKDLVDMLQLILNSLGVHASTYVANSCRENRVTCYAVSSSLNQFYSIYTKYKHLFREKDIVQPNKSRGHGNIDKYALYKVINVEEIEEQEGYDLCLFDEPHTYLAGNVIVSNCPAFLYWGYKYMAWKRGYGIYPEYRVPKFRNVQQRGFLCKHLYNVLSIYPFIANKIYKEIKNQ